MKKDPYDILGVPADADDAAVKRAYRDKARKVHPDHGGNAEEFALVTWARDLLMDPDRRARYDSTGDASEKAPDNAMATALETLHRAFGDTLDNIRQTGRQPQQVGNFIDMLLATLAKIERDMHKQMAEIDQSIEESSKLLGRFKPKSGSPALEALISGQITYAEQAKVKRLAIIKSVKAAVEIVKDHTFRADPEARNQVNAGGIDYLLMNLMNARGFPPGFR